MISYTTAKFMLWADEHIPAGLDSLLLKFKEEAQEFLDDPCPGEAADVLFCLVRICRELGINLHEAAEDKFEVIRDRQYELMPDGTWHHIKEPA